MGFISMSPGFVSAQTTNILGNNVAGSTAYPGNLYGAADKGMLVYHQQSTGEVGGRFAIMKGAVPTDFSTLTSYSVRMADTLVLFDSTPYTSTSGTNAFAPTQQDVNPMIISTIYINATASGTATWYWWFTTPLSGSNIWNNTILPYNQIIGTVGVSGSGADLTLPSVAITSGNPYRIFNYRLQIPASWTF
jgi:hypothetical protein